MTSPGLIGGDDGLGPVPELELGEDAAIATLVGIVFVLPLLLRGAGKFLPEMIAANSLSAARPVPSFTWSPWAELGVVALYAAVALAVGGWLLTRRDA